MSERSMQWIFYVGGAVIPLAVVAFLLWKHDECEDKGGRADAKNHRWVRVRQGREAQMKATLRVLVCGGRDFSDFAAVYRALDLLDNMRGLSGVVCGGAAGADALAMQWAKDREKELQVFRPDWVKFGKSAGPRRNTQMLKEGRPDFVLAFPGGSGTADMVSKATEAGLPVLRELW